MTDAELLSWAKTIVGGLISSGIGLGAVKWFIIRPVERAELAEKQALEREAAAKKEAEGWKELWKDEQRARDKRIDDAESAVTGRPSRPPRAELPTMSMLVESTPKKQHEEEVQRLLLEDRARGMQSSPLEAFAPPPRKSNKARLPPGAGGEDYAEMRLRNERGEIVTPVEFRPRLKTHRDPDPTSPGGFDEPDAGMKSPPGSLFPPPRPERKKKP